MTFVWPGKLSLRLADGWRLSEPGDLIEIIPPDDSGAVHLSLLLRTELGPPSTADAHTLIGWFARGRGCESVEVELRQHEDRAEGMAAFESMEDGLRTRWYVKVKVWRQAAILASYCTAPSDQAHLGAFLEMVESAVPDSPAAAHTS